MSIIDTSARFYRSLVAGYDDPDLKGLIQWVGLILVVGTIFYHFIERWSILDSFYFSVMTLLTASTGGLAPETELGKMFTIIFMAIGATAFIGFLAIYIEHHRTSQKEA